MPTIIVFCHLRWDFVFQRPQHLLTRLAKHYKIVMVEEPIHHDGGNFLKKTEVAPNVTVCQPHTNIPIHGFHDDQIPSLKPLLANLVADGEDPIVWFYTPMALPLLQDLHPSLVVYDCMDELAAFKNSPKQLLQRETALLGIADIVFTGGPSLYEAKRERHANAHCFSSSVDAAHFRKSLDRGIAHESHQDIPHPRLGFYGVIDERFDIDLLTALADARPGYHIVLVGPVVKIDPATLPQRPNIHYMGQQSYDALPTFLAAWDVCLLPFALNDSTRFISPTKVLEYMAAELPCVSTPITDVKLPYGHVVAIAHTDDEFIGACDAAVAMTPEQKAAMVDAMRTVVAGTSWDVTVDGMRALINSAPRGAKGLRSQVLPPTVPQHTSKGAVIDSLHNQRGLEPVKCVVVGAGPTGLSAAYHLGSDTLLIERNATVGGWCRSIKDNGFTFDYAGHIMFSNDPYVLKLYDVLLGSNVHWQNREAWVYSKNVFTRYPFQGALYGLPPKVIKECIVGAMEARFGDLKAEPGKAPGPAIDDKCDTKGVQDCCADGTVEIANSSTSKPGEVKNFEEFIYKVWGKGIAKHFAIPYNKKIWTVPLTDMETSWLGGRVPLPDLEEIIEGALEPVGKPMGPNARFGYPLKGGFQALMNGFVPHIRGKIALNASVVEILPKEHLIALADGRRFRYDDLISTMPLPELVKMIGEEAPAEVRKAAAGLKHISIRNVNIGIDRPNATDKHWVYYPEDTIFHRIFVQGNASPECNAPGGFGFTCEISYSPWKPLPVDGDELIKRAIADCIKVGMIKPDDTILAANLTDMPYAYVVYDHQRAHNVETVKKWLEQYNITLAGRYSEWEYYNSDHAFLAGKKAAEKIRAADDARSLMKS